MSYSGTARDLKRAIHGAKVQDEMREAFQRRVTSEKFFMFAQIAISVEKFKASKQKLKEISFS